MPYQQTNGKRRGAHNNAQGGNGQETAARKAEDPKSAEASITPENYYKPAAGTYDVQSSHQYRYRQ